MATSELQERTLYAMYETLHKYDLRGRANYRPKWLTYTTKPLELDIYIAKLKLAVEVQGEQHRSYVPYFHGSLEGFRAQEKRDAFKRATCEERGILLMEVNTERDIPALLERAKELVTQYDVPIKDIYLPKPKVEHKAKLIKKADFIPPRVVPEYTVTLKPVTYREMMNVVHDLWRAEIFDGCEPVYMGMTAEEMQVKCPEMLERIQKADTHRAKMKRR